MFKNNMLSRTTSYFKTVFSSADSENKADIAATINCIDPGLKVPAWVTDVEVIPQAHKSSAADLKGGLKADGLPQFAEQYRYAGVTNEFKAAVSVTNHSFLNSVKGTKKHKSGEYYYGGPVFKSFGHFLSESIHRLAPLETISSHRAISGVIFLPQRSRLDKSSNKPLLPSHFYDVLKYFGVDKKQIMIPKASIGLGAVWVAPQESLFRSRACISEAYRQFLLRCEAKARVHEDPKLPQKLYVSRTSFLLRGSFAGERYLEELLRKEGYFIFKPEKYDLLTQLNYYKSAKQIIFAEGGALHVLELLGQLKATIHVIQRRRGTDVMFKPLLSSRCEECSFFSELHVLPSLFIAKGQASAAAGSALSVLESQTFANHIQGYLVKEEFNLPEFNRQVASDIKEYYEAYEKRVKDSKAPNRLLTNYKDSVMKLHKKGKIEGIIF